MKNNKVLQYIVIYLSGVMFAVGLGIAGMTNPVKVMAFLDFFGKWDATLIFVLGAATGTNLLMFRWVLKRPHPILTSKFLLPTRTDIDSRLVMGAALFGVGWGMAGYCPGPAITSIASGSSATLLFVLMMTIGLRASHQVDSWMQHQKQKRESTANSSSSSTALAS
ncbi:MAG: YeeE/YedE family protein [Deltaproteobacteria bacterium]|nr:MAG: YeeE/YedE family protein [Deltaproteobacteria bacterium]